MDITPYVDNLRRELAVAAEAGGEDARTLAERLMGPLESATRLVLLDALSAAADEITRDLAPGSVEVRLRGRHPDFVVTPPAQSQPADTEQGYEFPSSALPPPDTDDSATSRITLRLPESLKTRVDEAATREGLSANSWLVRAISGALEPGRRRRTARRERMHGGERYTGWVR